MTEEKWLLGRVSRREAEDLLNNAGVDGSFVVRSSESIPGAYALSVLHNKTIHTYRVLPTDTGLLAIQTLNGVQQRKFNNLHDLVREYYSSQNGLVCGLTHPVGFETNKSTKLPSTVDLPQLPQLPQLPHFTSRDSIPLPPTPNSVPVSVPNRPSHVKGGVKVMVQIGDINIANGEKLKEVRNLPPVPAGIRDAQQRPTPKLVIAQSNVAANVDSKDAEIITKFLSRLTEIKNTWPSINETFVGAVQIYSSDGGLMSDLANIRRGGGQCAELQTLLATEAVAFQSELENFLKKIDILRQLFDFSSPPRRSHAYSRVQDTDVDLDTFLGRLGDCQTVVKSLNKRACINLQELLGISNTPTTRIWSRKQSKAIVPLTERTFEVKQDGAIMFSKQKLKVDMIGGTLSLTKGDGTTQYDHTQVLQIVKNNKSKTKLSILFEGNKKRDYTFEQSTQREAFCQLMQHLRNKHCESKEPDNIKIFCGSWNMGDAMPPNDITSWFMCNGSGRCLDQSVQAIPHDMYVIGTQETGMPEKDWMHKVIDTLHDITGTKFSQVAMDALWHIKILILVKEEYKNRISHVQTSSVKTGIANALGNKGAVAVSFQFGGTSFCFINAHLTSGAEKCVRRNQNYHDIVRLLNLGEDRFREFDLTNRFDHLYFLGDLNYRLEMDIQQILAHIKKKETNNLYQVDQLRREKDSNKVFAGFNEEEILFPPTYRYERGTRDSYSHLKVKKTGIRINVPSWCDRVLWKSYPETHNVCLAYGCSDDIMTSDHSPLFSNFEVGVRGQYVSNEEISTSTNNLSQASITFETIKVILKAPGKSSFYLQFHSVCLASAVKSSKNNKFETSDQGYNHVKLVWHKDNLPQLKPLISDREYLIDQHILVSVRAEDDSEVHGECVIALRSIIEMSSHNFKERLNRKGEETGSMEGHMFVRASDSSRKRREKTYEFIRRDDDMMRLKIESAVYSDIPDPSPHSSPPSFRPKLPSIDGKLPKRTTPQPQEITSNAAATGYHRVVTGIKQAPGEERQYADTTVFNASSPSTIAPPNSSSPNAIPSISNATERMSPVRAQESPRKALPLPQPSSSDCNPSKSHIRIAQSSNKMEETEKPVVAPRVRPVPTPRSVSQPAAAASQAAVPPNATFSSSSPSSPHKPISRRPEPTITDLDDTLAELAKMGNMIDDVLMQPTPIGFLSSHSRSNLRSPVPHLSFSNVDSLYDVPGNMGLVKNKGDVQSGNAGFSAIKSSFAPDTNYASPSYPSPSLGRRRQGEVRSIPATINEFLSSINLQRYANALQENGWDSIEFLSDMTEEDLLESGIINPLHCNLILEKIQSLNL